MDTEINPNQEALQAGNQDKLKEFLRPTKGKLVVLVLVGIVLFVIIPSVNLVPPRLPEVPLDTVNPEEKVAPVDFKGESVHTINLEEKVAVAAFRGESIDLCAPGRKPIDIYHASYGDLDADGSDEVAILAYTCESGTGGVNLDAVYKLSPEGSLIELKRDTMFLNESLSDYEPRETVYKDTMTDIVDGTLVETIDFYGRTTSTPNLLSAIKIHYRWDSPRAKLVAVGVFPLGE